MPLAKKKKIRQLERRLQKSRETVRTLNRMMSNLGDILLDTKNDLYYKRRELDDLRASSHERIENLEAALLQTGAILDSASKSWCEGNDSALTDGINAAMEVLLREIDR